METTIPFSDTIIQDMITDSIEKVFSTMLMTKINFKRAIPFPLTPKAPPLKPINTTEPLIASSVGFIGNINGVVFLYLEENLSIQLTASLLGSSYEEVDRNDHDAINDALGELTNMIVGTFKNKLCDMGYNCRLTIPSILRGNDFSIESRPNSPVIRRCYEFEAFNKPYVADLLIKPVE